MQLHKYGSGRNVMKGHAVRFDKDELSKRLTDGLIDPIQKSRPRESLYVCIFIQCYCMITYF